VTRYVAVSVSVSVSVSVRMILSMNVTVSVSMCDTPIDSYYRLTQPINHYLPRYIYTYVLPSYQHNNNRVTFRSSDGPSAAIAPFFRGSSPIHFSGIMTVSNEYQQ